MKNGKEMRNKKTNRRKIKKKGTMRNSQKIGEREGRIEKKCKNEEGEMKRRMMWNKGRNIEGRKEGDCPAGATLRRSARVSANRKTTFSVNCTLRGFYF
jgi:hypothetical protein